MNQLTAISFQNLVWQFYAHNKRSLPWRQVSSSGYVDPYEVLVSEFMLQQTQVARVIPKFRQFMRRFPTIFALAEAPLSEVLKVWNGLGYNRRAKYLWQVAQVIIEQHNGQLPQSRRELEALPGIGPGTAGALLVYSYNRPEIFIETNIRTVYIFHFLNGRSTVDDREVTEKVKATLDTAQPREWYWALMDYGSYLKSSVGNISSRSKHYAKQAPFDGSTRQLRGRIITLLTVRAYPLSTLQKKLPDSRLPKVLNDLKHDGLIEFRAPYYQLQ